MTDAPTSGRLEGRRHLLPVRVYFEDTDLSGRVYHARYLHFMERARSDMLRLLGIVHTDLLAQPEPAMFAVTRMQIAFKAPAKLDDALLVRTSVRAATGVRLRMVQQVVRDGEVLVEAEVEAACLTPDGRPRRAPKAAMAAMGPLLPPELNPNTVGVPKKS